jgi:hypothetical protein
MQIVSSSIPLIRSVARSLLDAFRRTRCRTRNGLADCPCSTGPFRGIGVDTVHKPTELVTSVGGRSLVSLDLRRVERVVRRPELRGRRIA